MNKKWMCGIAALAFFTSLAMGQTKPISNFGAATEGERKQALGEYWSAYAVPNAGGSDNVTAISNPGTPGSYDVLFEEDSEWAVALVGYTLGPSVNMGTWDSYPQAAVGLDVGTGYNLSGCTGFRYQFKGAKHLFKAELSTVTPDAGNAHFKVIDASSNWTQAEATTAQMIQDQYADDKVTFDPSLIAKFAFEVGSKPDQPGSAATGELYVKDFVCIGSYTEPAPGSSSSGGGGDPGSSSSGGGSPILSNGVAITGLNVAHFARSLHIASGKDATVSLFDMHGKQVFSKKVLAGESVVSLENQRQGVYYAVVRSGSLKQTVKVVLK